MAITISIHCLSNYMQNKASVKSICTNSIATSLMTPFRMTRFHHLVDYMQMPSN